MFIFNNLNIQKPDEKIIHGNNLASGDDLLTEVENKTIDLKHKHVQLVNLQTEIRTKQEVRKSFVENSHKLRKFAQTQDGCSYEVVKNFLDTNYSYPQMLHANISTQTSRSKKLMFNFGNPRVLTTQNQIKWPLIMRSDDLPDFALGIRKIESDEHKGHLLTEIILRSGKGHRSITVGIKNHGNSSNSLMQTIQAPAERNVVAVSILWAALLDKTRKFLDLNGDLWISVENWECF